jgi:hypothetical protein
MLLIKTSEKGSSLLGGVRGAMPPYTIIKISCNPSPCTNRENGFEKIMPYGIFIAEYDIK